jgi:murein DD-endopeptidase MepM/ murein hydrolase activator NlpD
MMLRFGARSPLTLATLIALGVLGACARTGPPAPVVLHTHPGARAAAVIAIPHPDRVEVRPGDTLYGISRRYGVPVRSIIDANALSPPYRLLAGTELTLPQVREYIVRPGDTLYGISRLYGVDTSTLARTNHLAPPYTIRVGEALALPSRPQPLATAQVAAVSAPPPAQRPAPQSTPQRATVSSAPLPSPAAVAPPRLPPAQEARSAVPQPTPSPAAHNGAASSPPNAASAAEEPPPPPQTAALSPPLPAKAFIWPVQGRILSAYGPGPGGTHNDGINIAAPAGTPVLAARDGVVAYAGNELRGYGYLILLKHADGWMTAYAHNEKLLVKRGQRVKRGQPIAKVGETGAVSEPQLHFEIRRGTRALDPTDYLPAVAAASG